MNSQTTTLGGLKCRIVDRLPEGQAPQLVTVLCHGFGASGDDLVPIGAELLNLNPGLSSKVRFIFPEAPLSLDEFGMYGARAWWPLDIAKLNAAIATGEFRDLRNDLPDELPQSRQMLMDMITEVSQQTGLPVSRFVLGGFSQGAMLATDVALRLPEPPAALCIWSGTLLCEEIWKELAAKRGPLTVLQSHGRQDPLLPFKAAIWLRDIMMESNFDVDFVEFDGVHTIPFEAMQRFAAVLGGLSED